MAHVHKLLVVQMLLLQVILNHILYAWLKTNNFLDTKSLIVLFFGVKLLVQVRNASCHKFIYTEKKEILGSLLFAVK